VRAVTQTRLVLLAVLGLYAWIVYDLSRGWVMQTDDQLIGFMLLSVVAVILFGAWAVRLRPSAMYYVFLVATLLQAFAMIPMLVVEWRPTREVLYLNSLLLMSLVFLAYRSKREGMTGS